MHSLECLELSLIIIRSSNLLVIKGKKGKSINKKKNCIHFRMITIILFGNMMGLKDRL